MKKNFDENKLFKISMIVPLIIGPPLLVKNVQIGLGVIFGGLMGAMILRILTLQIYQLLTQPQNKVATEARKGYIKRYFLYGATLAISILNHHINFFATIVGLLIPRIIIVLSLLIQRRKKNGV